MNAISTNPARRPGCPRVTGHARASIAAASASTMTLNSSTVPVPSASAAAGCESQNMKGGFRSIRSV